MCFFLLKRIIFRYFVYICTQDIYKSRTKHSILLTNKILKNMKKLLFISAAFVGMLFVTSCSNNDDPTPPAPTPGTTYLKILKEDVNTCLEKYPAYKKESQFDYPYGYFLEARYTLNGNVADLPASELVPVSVDYGFAYTTGSELEEKVHILNATRVFADGPDAEMTYKEVEESGYPQDLSIIKDLDKIISLEHAIMQVKKSNVVQPTTNIVRLRRPTLPDSGFRTIYRFDVAKGEKTVVYVDAATGAVETGEVL